MRVNAKRFAQAEPVGHFLFPSYFHHLGGGPWQSSEFSWENCNSYFRVFPFHFRACPIAIKTRMKEKKHLRMVRAVQRVVAAAKELTDAERALKRPTKKARREQATTQQDGTGNGQDAQEVHRD